MSDAVPRRHVLKVLAGIGIGSTVFYRALAAEVEKAGQVTPEMIKQAEWIAGLELSDEERESTARAVDRAARDFRAMRDVEIGYDVMPAILFNAAPTKRQSTEPPKRAVSMIEAAAPKRPASKEDLAFLPVTELAALMRARRVSSIELTKLYLERLKRYDDALHCVVTLTEDLALEQAKKMDREIAAGRYRGSLHGIPWGAKDLIAYPGYGTGWGAAPFKDQMLDVKATVAQRLEEAGAVLVAKLALGALAMGDKWYGGMTRNPWNPKEGSSGSSAGSASATAAGLVGFSLGSETLGSIISPSRRCGTSGLRPTFGRVSRYGCMSLAWSMDKIGPICRSVEDCALVLAAIHGHDGFDPTAVDQPFQWPPKRDLRQMTIGFFATDGAPEKRSEIKVLEKLGAKLVRLKLPDRYPVWALTMILNAECAAVFDPLTRNSVTEGIGRWANTFRQGQFIPAVEYLRANRIRTLLMQEMEAMLAGVDAYVGGNDLSITNLTGHPTVVLPNGFKKRGGAEVPTSITFTGKLFGETDLLTIANAYQRETGFHLRHPTLKNLSAFDDKSDKG